MIVITENNSIVTKNEYIEYEPNITLDELIMKIGQHNMIDMRLFFKFKNELTQCGYNTGHQSGTISSNENLCRNYISVYRVI